MAIKAPDESNKRANKLTNFIQKDIKDLTGAEWREVISQAMIFMWGRVNIFWFDHLHKSEFLVFVRSWTPG